MRVLDAEKEGLALVVHLRVHFAHVASTPADNNGTIVVTKVLSIQFEQLHKQHA